MLGTAIFLERDECGSIPVIRCFPAGSHAPAAELTCSSGYGWDGCDTPCTVQHRIRNCVLRSAGKILEEPGRMLQQCCTFCVLRSEEHTSELQSHSDLVCRLLLEKKKD